jgi:hypothetical protein
VTTDCLEADFRHHSKPYIGRYRAADIGGPRSLANVLREVGWPVPPTRWVGGQVSAVVRRSRYATPADFN